MQIIFIKEDNPLQEVIIGSTDGSNYEICIVNLPTPPLPPPSHSGQQSPLGKKIGYAMEIHGKSSLPFKNSFLSVDTCILGGLHCVDF